MLNKARCGAWDTVRGTPSHFSTPPGGRPYLRRHMSAPTPTARAPREASITITSITAPVTFPLLSSAETDARARHQPQA